MLEVLLNSRSELLVCVIHGFLHVIEDISVSETDLLVLVC